MKTLGIGALVALLGAAGAADVKVDLSKETVGKPPVSFVPMVGTWTVVRDGNDKVVMVDGRPWTASRTIRPSC